MSEEQKAIEKLKEMTNNFSLNSEVLHYIKVLYNLILNLQQENKKLKDWKELHSSLTLAKENIRVNEENKQLKEFKKEIVETVEQVSRNEYFYKYNNKYLRSELINEFQRIIGLYTEECSLRHEIDLKFDIAKTQQKRFISWLENRIKEYKEYKKNGCKYYDDLEYWNNIIIIYKEILLTYKEIIGDSDE